MYVKNKAKNARTSWIEPIERFAQTKKGDLVGLSMKFAQCKLRKIGWDPMLWYLKLSLIDCEFGRVDKTYMKDNTEMNANVLAKLPCKYSEMVTALRKLH